MQVMGQVPPVEFVRDDSEARIRKVDELLKVADMGPGHVSPELGHNLKSDVSLYRHTMAPPVRMQDRLSSVSLKWNKDAALTYTEGIVSEEALKQRYGMSMSHDESQGANSMTNHDTGLSGDFQHVPAATSPGSVQSDVSNVELGLHGLHLRWDLYELEHDELMKKVLQTKRRSQSRRYSGSIPTAMDGVPVNASRAMDLEVRTKKLRAESTKAKKLHRIMVSPEEDVWEETWMAQDANEDIIEDYEDSDYSDVEESGEDYSDDSDKE